MYPSHDNQVAIGAGATNSNGQEDRSNTRNATAEVVRSALANHKTIGRLLPLFIGDLPGQVASVFALIAEGDLIAARRIVHGLKGCGGGYGFPDITRLATQAEILFDQGADRIRVQGALEELAVYLRRIEGYEPSRERVAA
jgi:HPt (histidine-containing phosphotransfer) domain-containing protein